MGPLAGRISRPWMRSRIGPGRSRNSPPRSALSRTATARAGRQFVEQFQRPPLGILQAGDAAAFVLHAAAGVEEQDDGNGLILTDAERQSVGVQARPGQSEAEQSDEQHAQQQQQQLVEAQLAAVAVELLAQEAKRGEQQVFGLFASPDGSARERRQGPVRQAGRGEGSSWGSVAQGDRGRRAGACPHYGAAGSVTPVLRLLSLVFPPLPGIRINTSSALPGFFSHKARRERQCESDC